MDKTNVTTFKYRKRSKYLWNLPVVFYQGSKYFKKLQQYQTPAGLLFYQATFEKGTYSINLGGSSGAFSRTKLQDVGSRSGLMFTAPMNNNRSVPSKFMSATEISEDRIKWEEDKLIIDLSVKRAPKKSLPATSESHANSNAQLLQAIEKLQKMNVQPPMDMDELATTLAKKISEKVADQTSSQLAQQIMNKLTRSDDFMNRIAETVGFKLSTVISTRMNRLEESIKSEMKQQLRNNEKHIEQRTYDLFKQAGWLK